MFVFFVLEICYQAYAEITNGDWKPRTQDPDEDAVKAACTENENCIGYWELSNGKFGTLQAGTRTWAKNKPNSSVKRVWKKSTDCFSGCYHPKAEIMNGEWKPKTQDADEDAVKAICSENKKCLGYWELSNGKFGTLQAGTRTWAKNKPNTSVKEVWKKSTNCSQGKIISTLNYLSVSKGNFKIYVSML